jgi:hypothetical protein
MRTWVLVLLLGCGGNQKVVDITPAAKDESVCPEYRDLHCVGSMDCSMSPERGCRVCHCADATNGVFTPPSPARPGREGP